MIFLLWMWLCVANVVVRLSRVCIRLDDSEHIPGWILCVSEPADFRDCHLWHANPSTSLLNLLHRLIKRWNTNGVQRTGSLTFARTAKSAVNSRLLVIASRDEPILDRPAFELLEFPTKDVVVKRADGVRIVRVNFEMNYAWHI